MFDDRVRTSTEPLRGGENLFDFYDNCARPGYVEFRSVMNEWLAEMAAGERGELASRFRFGGNREFVAATCELITHRFLKGSGLIPQSHPTVPGSTKRPDFAAEDNEGAIKAYVEVTTSNLPASLVGEMNRENAIYDAIDAADIPSGGVLGYRLLKAGQASPPLRPLVAAIEQWALANLEAARSSDVVRTFDAGDWRIELELYASTGAEAAVRSLKRAIGIRSLRGGLIKPQKDIRSALKTKADRYGELTAPYLIVVCDAKEQLFNQRAAQNAITEAVFGDEYTQFVGTIMRRKFARNGLWHGRGGATINKHVSGVVLLPQPSIWKLRDEKWEPILAINPWADSVLPAELREITRYEAQGERWVLHDGARFADVLDMPDPWPPE